MQLFLMLLLHIIKCLQTTNTLLLIIVVLLLTNLILTHTKAKTWLAKARWGVGYGLRKLLVYWDQLDMWILKRFYKREE